MPKRAEYDAEIWKQVGGREESDFREMLKLRSAYSSGIRNDETRHSALLYAMYAKRKQRKLTNYLV